MKNIEVLSPVGDMKNFYTAIKSGADAVYLGLPKYNARMKADNITLDNLSDLVRYAHLKNVKVYVTLNTIVTDKEIDEIVELVEECNQMKVDAYIVQDLGLISRLRVLYPDIILHGSTQLGVHNVRGARVAKNMGLSRVVLSREATISDIREIAQNVDIELEVFVQGANCVCFSGNCYMSSIKCNASGNRGECKQLCRLPYTLADDTKKISGYAISPRDNCMLRDIKELCDSGVISFKIEGRLKTSTYVAVTTNAYKTIVNEILNSKEFCDTDADKIEQKIVTNQIGKFIQTNESSHDNSSLSVAQGVGTSNVNFDELENNLYRVFARGKYTRGYNDGNDIIDTKNNNHIGVKIGKVISCRIFKDLYKITMELDKTIHTGDGLKFYGNGDIISLGVGNIEVYDNNYIVYGKNKVESDAIVYLSNDTTIEDTIPDISNIANINMRLTALVGKPLNLKISANNLCVSQSTIVCEHAKNSPTSIDTFKAQLSKIDHDLFEIGDIEIVSDSAYVPLSEINNIRRQTIDILIEKLLHEYNENHLKYAESIKAKNDYENVNILKNSKNIVDYNDSKYLSNSDELSFDKIAMVDETTDISRLKNDYPALILSPNNYSVEVITNFVKSYKKYFKNKLIVNLPIIARIDNLKIVDDIVEQFKDRVIFIANNIYSLDYMKLGATIWAGSGLNIVNNYAVDFVKSLGAKETIMSIEKWCNRLPNTYKIVGKPVLMTMTACPVKTLYRNDCSDCKFNHNLTLENAGNKYTIRRIKIANCYFEIVDTKTLGNMSNSVIVDLR